MPLANCTTAANGSEKEQVLPLLDSVKLKTLKKGRPKKRVKVLAADSYDSKEKRFALRKRGIRPQLPKRVYAHQEKSRKTNQNICSSISYRERCFAWYQRCRSPSCRSMGTSKNQL